MRNSNFTEVISGRFLSPACVDRGVNRNLLIEVGAMVMTGRRCARLKDGSVAKLPTDLIGMIYKSVDLRKMPTVKKTIASWITDDLNIK
jgi:hypothetical protein